MEKSAFCGGFGFWLGGGFGFHGLKEVVGLCFVN